MNPYPNFNPAQPYPPQGGLGFLKAMSTKAKLLIVGAVAVVGGPWGAVDLESYTMQCTPTATTFWPVAKRCVGVNSYGVGLIVFID
jgi:hypothetical protein